MIKTGAIIAFGLSCLASAAATPSAVPAIPKAVYFMSNKPGGNTIHALTVDSKGLLSEGSVTATGGNGSRAPSNMGLADSFNSQGSLQVLGNYLFGVNAGSNTLSMLAISPSDPLNLSVVGKPMDTLGDFPNSVGVSAARQMACVANTGTRSGVACYNITSSGLVPIDTKLRPIFLSPTQSRIPVGPLNTVSQVFFSQDSMNLYATVKGSPTGDDGFFITFPLGPGGEYMGEQLSTPNGTLALFGSVALPNDYVFATDASFGVTLLKIDPRFGAQSISSYKVPNQIATCWATQNPSNGIIYTSDDGTNQINGFDPNTGNHLGATNLAANIPNMIELSSAGSVLYALSHGNGTIPPQVIVMQPQGKTGTVKQVQNFYPKAVGINVEGLALLM